MTRFEASTPKERRALVAEAVTAHRKRGSDAAVFEADCGDGGGNGSRDRNGGGTGTSRIEYSDRTLTLAVDPAERDRLDTFLDEFPVFKIEQPATRKAPGGVVHVSAIADQKHAADFVDRAFAAVYGCPDDFRLWVTAV